MNNEEIRYPRKDAFAYAVRKAEDLVLDTNFEIIVGDSNLTYEEADTFQLDNHPTHYYEAGYATRKKKERDEIHARLQPFREQITQLFRQGMGKENTGQRLGPESMAQILEYDNPLHLYLPNSIDVNILVQNLKLRQTGDSGNLNTQPKRRGRPPKEH